MGRKPLAPEINEQSGYYTKHPERRNPDAPRADGQAPAMPDYLTEIERSKWLELVADLRSMGILSTDCRELLISYCAAFAGWMECRAAVAKDGPAITRYDYAGNKQIKQNPYSAELHRYRAAMDRLLPEFGLTPSSRSRLVAFKDDGEADPMVELLKRMGASKN